jgi:uncharacterized Zn finger protein (UPF0148 family)
MTPPRRRSLLEDDELTQIDERAAASSGDVCERCECPRFKHHDGGCECGRCEGFVDVGEEE